MEDSGTLVIAAAGAFERPMIFPDNDRPGVMLAGAAEKYAHAFGVACGERVVIAANSDPAYRVAASLRGAGVNVTAIIDRRAGRRRHARAAQGLAELRGLSRRGDRQGVGILSGAKLHDRLRGSARARARTTWNAM